MHLSHLGCSLLHLILALVHESHDVRILGDFGLDIRWFC